MDVHDRGMLYYRLLKHSVQEARRVVCGQHKVVASRNTIIPRVSPDQTAPSLLLLLAFLWSTCVSRCVHAFASIASLSRQTFFEARESLVSFLQHTCVFMQE